MIVVFWLTGPIWQAEKQIFEADELGVALKFAEELRGRRRAGEPISHVCMQSELPEVVGEAGVADPSKDYDWRKRREDPATFGRPGPGDDMVEDLT